MNKAQFRKQQSGFTLIELVVVIVILGILAATAIPRFTGMQVDARKAALKGMLAAVQSASAIAHAQALVQNQTGPTGTITMEGVSVGLVHGYPSTATGIAAALTSFDGFGNVVPGTFTLTGATDTANCKVTYAQPTGANLAPAIGSIDTGC